MAILNRAPRLLTAGAGVRTRQAWLILAAQNLVLLGACAGLLRAAPAQTWAKCCNGPWRC